MFSLILSYICRKASKLESDSHCLLVNLILMKCNKICQRPFVWRGVRAKIKTTAQLAVTLSS